MWTIISDAFLRLNPNRKIIILPFVWCGYETWSLLMRENRETEGMRTGRWGECLDQSGRNLQEAGRYIKFRRLVVFALYQKLGRPEDVWSGRGTCTLESDEKCVLSIGRKIWWREATTWKTEAFTGKVRKGAEWSSGQRPFLGCCEHGYELNRSVKDEKFLD